MNSIGLLLQQYIDYFAGRMKQDYKHQKAPPCLENRHTTVVPPIMRSPDSAGSDNEHLANGYNEALHPTASTFSYDKVII
jgi:hypothetical protein